MHKGEIEVIQFELSALRCMQMSARPDIADAARRRIGRLQEELDLLEAQERFVIAAQPDNAALLEKTKSNRPDIEKSRYEKADPDAAPPQQGPVFHPNS